MNHQLYTIGLIPPHTAAGINLNFWPIGILLRRGGAFFLRRSFKGNKLYTVVFSEYIHFLITHGYPILIFPEGGRSRTGKTLTPKTGMLSMILNSYLRDNTRKIVFIPTYIGYDRVIEISSYLKEIGGQSKKNESMGQLLGARKIFSLNLGKPYISFGEPIFLEEYLKSEHPQWNTNSPKHERPVWLRAFTDKLANKIMTHINRVAVLNYVNLYSLAMLSENHKAMTEQNLLELLEILLALVKDSPYAQSQALKNMASSEVLPYVEKIGGLTSRLKHLDSDIIYLDNHQTAIAKYYRNNILHIYVLDCLIACYVKKCEETTITAVINFCKAVYPFVAKEFFMHWTPDQLEGVVTEKISVMIKLRLMKQDGDRILCPDISNSLYDRLGNLSRTMELTVLQYAVATVLLTKFVGLAMQRSAFEERFKNIVTRGAMISGFGPDTSIEATHLKLIINAFQEINLLRFNQEGNLLVSEEISTLSEIFSQVLVKDLQILIERTTLDEQN